MHPPIASLRTPRRTVVAGLLAAAVLPAHAQQGGYPGKPIEWVVPYPPGGGTDAVARTLAEAVGKSLGQPVVINNKPGAATNIGAEYAARARPDGYVILSADTATLAANPFLYPRLGYSAEKDFEPVALTVRFPLILVVHPAVPAKNLQEFTTWARAQAGGAQYASPGAGSPHHLATELLRAQLGVPMVHVPYRGLAPAVQDVVGGQVPFMFVDPAGGYQFIATGKLRPIGVASARRVHNFDSIHTLQEQGLRGFEASAWQGVVAPAATPAEVVRTLNAALLAALDSTAVKARLQTLGLEAIPSSPQEMARYAAEERAKWGRVIRASRIKVD